MLLTDKKNRNYAYITLDDILEALEKYSELNDSEKHELKKLYNSHDFIDDKLRISKKSKTYHILKDCSAITDGDTYINPTMLSIAYTRASYEFNYEMKDRLFKYLKKYFDNLRESKSNDKLVQKILCDSKVMEYVHMYNSIEEYTKHIIGTRINKHTEEKVELKNRSYVKAA